MKKEKNAARYLLLSLVLLLFCAAQGYAFEKTIPLPKCAEIGGAASYEGLSNAPDSKYFAAQDYFTKKSEGSLVILSGFRTYQQSTETSCGPAAALMVLSYYGRDKNIDELRLVKEMKILNKRTKNGQIGTSTAKLVDWFRAHGFRVESSLKRAGKDGLSFQDPDAMKTFFIKKLSSGTPIMVEDFTWGGHWRVIIGYDTLGTKQVSDDVIIFADSYDTWDHKQDGYNVQNAEYFFYTWRDIDMLPRNQRLQQWLTVSPAPSVKKQDCGKLKTY